MCQIICFLPLLNHSQSPVRTEKPSLVEMRNGLIQVTPVENDQQPRSLVILTGLKTLFQKQLPKMPREYIARLVYDNNSKSLAIIKRGYKVAGGICYRPFAHRGFAEIVFFATNSADQEKVKEFLFRNHLFVHWSKYPSRGMVECSWTILKPTFAKPIPK